MASVLSTKRLSAAQKNLLLNANLGLTEYEAIQTKALKLTTSTSEKKYQNVIITSQRAVDLIQHFNIDTCFCVGEKTAQKLKSLGFNVELTCSHAEELAAKIRSDYAQRTFTFLGSAKRRPVLADLLREWKIPLEEVFVYDTILTPKYFERSFDAVLCFSPSGVESFFTANTNSVSDVICIGNTTAKKAKEYTNKVYIANSTSVESVIVKAVKVLKSKNPAN